MWNIELALKIKYADKKISFICKFLWFLQIYFKHIIILSQNREKSKGKNTVANKTVGNF